MSDDRGSRHKKLFHIAPTRGSIAHEIDDELRFHLDARTDELMRRGHTADDARRIALEEYGDVATARQQLARIDRRRVQRTVLREWLASLAQDVKFGLRGLRARPTFAATVILTLALGIGANAAIFSVVNAVLLRPLPYTHPERLVHLWEVYKSNVDSRSEASYPDYLDWRARNRSFSGMGGYHGSGVLFGVEHPLTVPAARSTANFFDVLGVHAVLGRTFAAGEDAPDAPQVALLSYGFWERQFARDSSVIGRAVTLDGRPATVIGVLPESFQFAREGQADIWLPLNRNQRAREQRGNHWLNVVARLRDGTTLAAASADLSSVMHALAREYPENDAGRDGQVVWLRDELLGAVRPLILVLYAAVAVMLLVACANVANLLLMRASDREREIAVRVALGAGRGRLVRQLLTESLLLAIIGGALGVFLAQLIARSLSDAVPLRIRATIPALASATVNGTVLTYVCLVSVAAGLLFGIVPALRGTRTRGNVALRDGARGSRGRSLRDLLVVAELALTIVLMSGAALFGRSLVNLLSLDLGFRPEHVVTTGVLLPATSYRDAPSRVAFFDRLLAAVQTIPGVQRVGLVSKLPLDFGNSVGFEIVGRPPALPGQEPTASYRDATAGYFQTLGIPLVEGRTFAAGDAASTPLVAVVNRAFAAAYFGGASPVGHSFVLNAADTARIVGVAGDVPIGNVGDQIPPTVYFNFAQDPSIFMQLTLRLQGDPAAASRSVGRTVAAIDPHVATTPPVAMERLIAASTSVFMRRFPLLLVGVFALATLALALVGVYGVVSYAVASRTRELGIRLALGAQPRNVVALVVRHGAWMAAAGVIIGLVGASLLGRFVAGLLYGVSARDPISFEIVALVLGGSAIVASLVPARRASKVDPAAALRAE